jgi:hypothetical protein
LARGNHKVVEVRLVSKGHRGSKTGRLHFNLEDGKTPGNVIGEMEISNGEMSMVFLALYPTVMLQLAFIMEGGGVYHALGESRR